MPKRALAIALSLSLIPGLTPVPLHAQEQTAAEARQGRVVGERVNVRSEASLRGRVLYQVSRGELLRVEGEEGGWLLVVAEGREPGYISAEFIELVAPSPEAAPVTAPSQDAAAPDIAHDPLECVVPEVNPEVAAGVTSQKEVKRSRVYFKAHQHPDWYYIDMRALEIPDYLALLPQPLPGTDQLDYYVHALDTTLQTSQTPQYDPEVIEGTDCERRPSAALPGMENELVVGGTVEGQAPVPPGFSPRGIIAFVTAAGVMLTGAALASGGGAAGGAAGAGAAAGGGGGMSAATIGLVAAGVVGAGVAVKAATGGGDDDGGGTSSGDGGGQQQPAGTGDVAFRLTWNSDADLDLYVQEPNGTIIFYGNSRSSTGGMLDVDSNAGCSSRAANPIENVFWSTGSAPRGQYFYWVDHFGCGPGSSYTVQVLRGAGGSVAASQSGGLEPGQEGPRFSFTF
jgi:hypothetical protein